MKNLICWAFAVMVLFLMLACQNKQHKNYNNGPLVSPDGISFLHNGIEGSLTEIKASGLAITNSNNQRVIGFAKMMIDDHTKTVDELNKLEYDNQVTAKDSINAGDITIINNLSNKTGRAFDKAYLEAIIIAHEQAVKLFTAATQNNDTGISKFAAATLPTIKMHLDSAMAISASLK